METILETLHNKNYYRQQNNFILLYILFLIALQEFIEVSNTKIKNRNIAFRKRFIINYNLKQVYRY